MVLSASKPHLIRNETTISVILEPPEKTTPATVRLEWGNTGTTIRSVCLRPSLVDPSNELEINFPVGEMQLNPVADQRWVTYRFSTDQFQNGVEKAIEDSDTQTYLRLEYVLFNAHTHSLPPTNPSHWFSNDQSIAAVDAIIVDDRQLIPITSDEML
jgi:hypothetical protein